MKVTRIILQKTALALGIVIVLNLFFNVAIAAFYQQPKYDDFCGAESRKFYQTEKSCVEAGGEWREYPPSKPLPPIGGQEGVARPEGHCNAQATCSKEYRQARSLYNRNVFIALVAAGAAAVGAGIFLSRVTAVSAGLLYGGLISFVVGSTRYWSDMDEYLRLAILGIVLAGLIWLGYKKLKD